MDRQRTMVETQIMNRGIKDTRLLSAMLKVERQRFVPFLMQSFAYDDKPLPIGNGQTISQPYIVAVMTELLELNENKKVLEIGTGSGYQAAIIGELAKELYTIEIVDSLAKSAEKTLKNLKYENIKVKSGDGYSGWKEYAPFDAIIITCAPPYIPKPLVEQLKEGGRMIVPLGVKVSKESKIYHSQQGSYTIPAESEYQDLQLLIKKNGKLEKKSICLVRFVPFTGDKIKEEEDKE